MQVDTALMIISSLADGCDPETGEILPRAHPHPIPTPNNRRSDRKNVIWIVIRRGDSVPEN